MDIFLRQMVILFMKVLLMMVNSMVMVLLNGKMENNIKDNFKTENFMVLVLMNGLMVGSLLVNTKMD